MCDLSKERKIEIEKEVSSLVGGFNFSTNPYVDIVSMVKLDNFVVERKDMDMDTTGCLLINNSNGEEERHIWVNKTFRNPDNEDDVVFKKSRFITAHEYGHFKLHKAISAHRDTYHRTDQIELEADYFARSVLMPLGPFRKSYAILNEFSNNDKTYVVNLLSKLFRVTRNKVNKRIEDLNDLESYKTNN